MKKRILASLMSLCLLVGLFPTAALAAEDPPVGQDEQPVVCTCEAPCTEESRDETCPVCMEDYTLCEAQAEPTTTEPGSDPTALPSSEDVSALTDLVCAELEGCSGDTHAEGCPLYVAPVEPVAENEINDMAALADDGMSGNCGNPTYVDGDTTPTDKVKWQLTQNNDGSENPTYTLTFSGTGDITWEWRTEDNKRPPYYSYATQITKVVVGEGITGGARAACAGFTALTEVSLPSTFSQIGNDMFSGCTSLTSIDLPASLTSIGNSAFNNCTSLSSVNFAEGTGEIKISGFYNCTSLKSITLPDKVTSINANTFEKSGLESITINPSVSCVIGQRAFAECTSLTSVTVGENVTSIGKQAFYEDTALTTVTISAKEIGEQAFGQCSNLANVTLNEGVTTIGNDAFATTKDQDKGDLKVLRLPSTITSIGTGLNQAYMLETLDMSAATNITFPSSGLTLGMDGIVYVSTSEIANALRTADGRDAVAIAVTNGGTFAENQSFIKDTFAAPIQDGKVFAGWYANADFTGTSAASPQQDNTGSATHYPIYYAKWIELNANKVSIQYGGTSSNFPSIEGVTLSNWQSSDTSIVSIENNQLKANKVGTTTITATATTTAGGTGTLTVEVGVTPMPITFGNASGENPSGTIDHVYDGMAPDYFDYAAFYPAEVKDGKVSIVADSQKIELTAGTDVVFVYDDGAGDGEKEHNSLPVNVTTTEGMSVTVKMLNPNYRFVTNTNTTPSETVSVTVKIHADNMEKQDLYINGEKVDVITGATVKVYNGEGQAPISDLTSVQAEGIETFTVHFHPLNSDTDFEEAHLESKPASELTSEAVLAIAPKEPGQYLMIVNGIKEATSPEKGSYAYASVVFSIEKATVTIKPNNITAYVGDEVPSLTDIGYTVTGLVGDDELTNTPTLSYESDPDMNTAGTYTIKASGAAADDELYELVYEDGTLTVSRRSSGGGSGSSSHSVSVDSDKNGTVSVNKNNASKGSTVTITVKPDSGYELGDLIVTDKDGNEIKLTDKGNGKYTFQMPNSKVEIEASFVPQADPDIGLPFVDVPSGSWYEDAVWYVYENGLMAGTSDTTFAPDITTSRSMIVTILYRLEGTPAVSGASGFTDVADGQYYTDAVAWAAANNIVGGYGNGLFGPDDTITREQMAAILYRYAQYKGYDVTASADLSGYSDAAQVNSYALAALQWANAEGLVNGTSDTTLTPGGSATRAQVAVILMRFCENIAG